MGCSIGRFITRGRPEAGFEDNDPRRSAHNGEERAQEQPPAVMWTAWLCMGVMLED